MKKLFKKIISFLLKKKRRFDRDRKRKDKQMSLYIGDNVLCPICNSKFKEFGPFGAIERKNAKCFTCDSVERHRLLWLYLNHQTDIFTSTKTLRLLHFAPEKVFYDHFSSNLKIEYYPCDLSPDLYNFQGKVDIIRADITCIPFQDAYFDVVICMHVLEHIPNDSLAMSELYRVMKNGAWAILQVPIDYTRDVTYEDFSINTPEGRLQAFGQSDHVRWYGKDYKQKLTQAGFKVVVDDFVKKFSPNEILKYGLMSSELIYYCKKE